MKLHEIGVERLIAGIYKQCAKDYAEALETGNKYRIKECERFFKSGAYGVEKSIGESIARRVKEDVTKKIESAYRKED